MKMKSTPAAVYAFMALGTSAAFATPTLTTLVNFTGTNGKYPDYGSLLADGSGNLYGTTEQGGSNNDGTIFKVVTGSNTLTTLATFTYINGAYPYAGLIADSAGDLYGTTYAGGSSGVGTVFELAAGSNTPSTLVAFSNDNSTGAHPWGGLLADGSGNLYGTTSTNLFGTVFEVAAGSNTLTTLVRFNNSNGASPHYGLIADASGNLYGTTEGVSGSAGTVFEIAAGTSTLTTLARFTTNGIFPNGLIVDGSGNLYGTTQQGGSSQVGTVFEIAAGSNAITTLATFNNTNGAYPLGTLIADASGNLYGTTKNGGSSSDSTVFELPVGSSTITTLATFTGTNGFIPYAGLIADASGNLYGTTDEGGSSNDGTVFELTGTGFAVPEPSSLTLASVGCLALLRRRRRMV